MKSIGERIKEERKKRGITQIVASTQIGISYPYLTAIEQGRPPGKPATEKIETWLKARSE